MRPKEGPEHKIQVAIIAFLKARGWHVERLIGNAFQSGLPDLLAFHVKWGSRFIEVKNAERYSFTKAQKIKWPVLERFNVGIWILTEATQEAYDSLFKPPNWRSFIKKTWNIPTLSEIDKLMEDIQ
jgi:hypothetical protein